jgi:type VI secretion system secreted protein VgrG
MDDVASKDLIQNSATLNRYLLKIYNQQIEADVLSFTATESLSNPYRYTIRFTSVRQNLPLDAILNNYASFYMRAPVLPRLKGSPQQWEQLRQVNGTITAFSRLDSSADEAVYECVLEHELALLSKTRRSAVYLNITVPELVKKVLLEHREFEPYNIDFDSLHHTYPARRMIIQWQETDLAFVQRLLSEVGIWYRFENHHDVQSEVVMIFGDSGGRYVFSDKKPRYVRHSGQSSEKEYVTDLQEFYSVIPDSITTRNYHYETADSPNADKSVSVHEVPEQVRSGNEYYYADNHREDGDFYGENGETATFNARIRHEYRLNEQSIFKAVTNDPCLSPGVMFNPQGNIPDGFKRGFVICQMEISGDRSEHYLAKLTGIPHSEKYCFRPERLPRPVIAGTVPARISTRERNGLYASTDNQGRYIVKFDFDLEEKEKGYESAFIRLGRPYAGDTFGLHFPLLDNTEVAIAFENGDPDRPFISHVLHDGRNKDLVTMRNDTRNVIRTPSFNKIRLEDRRGKEHIKIATEYGKSQLSTGHLVDASNKKRGEGIEARTDEWAAIRAAKGVLLTTEPQPRAQGQQLDMNAAIAALQSALSLAMTLQQCATTAGATAVDTASQEQLRTTLDQLKAPGLLAYADKGQAFATPATLQLSAGEDLVATAGSHASVNVLKRFSLAVGEKLSLFARKLGIQLIAGAGNVEAQAQRGEMHLLSQQDFTLMSTDGKLSGSARQGIQLVCGGGGIRINADGSVEIFSPTGIELKGPNLAVKGPESVKTTAPAFKNGTFKRRFRLLSPDDPDQFLPDQKFRLTSSTGKIIEGITDAQGHSSLLDGDDIETFKMELIHD